MNMGKLEIFKLKSLPIEIVEEQHIYKNDKKKEYEYTFDFYDSKQFKKLIDWYESENEKKLKKLQEINPDATREDVPDWIYTENFVVANVALSERVDNEEVENWEAEHEDDDEDLIVLKMDILELEDIDYEQKDSYFKVTEARETGTYGYVRVGKYEYIRVEEGEAAAIIVKGGKFGRWAKRLIKFILLTLGLSLFIAWFNNEGYSLRAIFNRIIYGIEDERVPGDDLTIGNGDLWNGGLETGENSTNTEMEYIDIAGYMNLYCNEANPSIRLINMGTALQCYEEFIITLDGEEVYRTDLIRPEQEVPWNCYETMTNLGLERGQTYWFNFHINNYEIKEDGSFGGALNGVDMEVDITLK